MKNTFYTIIFSFCSLLLISNNSYSTTNFGIDWQKKIQVDCFELFITDMQLTSDSGYVSCGYIHGAVGFNGFRKVPLVFKTNKIGEEEWRFTYYSLSTHDIINCIQQTSDKGYIVGGIHYAGFIFLSPQYIITKLDDTGAVAWQKNI